MSAPAAACEIAGADELIDGRVVGDLVVDHDAAVAVVRVLAKADVGDHQDVRRFPLDRADGRLHRPLRVVRGRPDVVFVVGEAEQQHALHAGGAGDFDFLDRFVNRQVVHARHRRHLAAHALALADEQRQHEHVRGQPGFAHERAQRFGVSEPSQPPRELHGRVGVRGGGAHGIVPYDPVLDD